MEFCALSLTVYLTFISSCSLVPEVTNITGTELNLLFGHKARKQKTAHQVAIFDFVNFCI